MLNWLAWLGKVPAVPLASMLLLCSVYFGSTRDLGAFLLSIPILGLLLLSSAVAVAWAGRFEVQYSRGLVAVALICLTVPAYLCSYGFTQRVRFLLWASAHHSQLARLSAKSGVIMEWDGWGIAGQDTSSYLVVDAQDRLESKSRADMWTKEIGQSCGSWQTQRMWPKFYVVATYTNCPYDNVPAS